MRKQKLYFDRCYDQWKGLDVAIEEEVNGYGLYIQVPDVDMVDNGTINEVTAIFEGIEEVANGEVYNAEERIIRIEMPPQILANDGLYRVTFTISIKKDEESILKNTAVQTFTILEAIEVSDEYIESYDKYSLLTELLQKATDNEIDTSAFAKKEYVEKLVEEALNGVNLDNIMAELEGKGIYVTKEQLKADLSSYITKHDSAQFALASDLNSYAKSVWVMNNYATQGLLTEKLKNYVSKENGKSLTSNDFTDELKEKLINIPEDGSDYDDTELRELIDKKASREFVIELFGDIQSIDLTKYYTIEEIIEIINNVNETHNTNIDNLENDVENTYLKKEDYEYMNGIHTDDVKINEEQNLTQFIENLMYEEIEIEEFKTTYITDIREYGETLTYVAFEWRLNKTPISQTLTDCTSTLYNDVRSYYISRQYSEDKTFTLTVTDGKVTKEKSVTIQFVKPYLYGTFTEDNLLLDTLENGNKIIDVKNNQTINLSYEDSSIFFAYPSSYGYLVDIKDNNGLSYFNDFESLIMFTNNENYNVYVLEEKATVSNISFSFIFEKEEE